MKHWLLPALLALCAFETVAADFTFGRPIRLTTAAYQSGSVAIGDVNGDGRKDLAAARYHSDGSILEVWLQRADGTLAAPLQTVLPGPYNIDVPIVFIDLDKDGTQELFVGLADAGRVQVTVRVVDGVLRQSTHATLKGCAFAATGDIDGDGFMDVACHDAQVAATVFFGNGTGGFRNRIDLPTPAGTWYTPSEFKSLQVGDVTGDGRPDLVVTSSLVSAFFVLENNGLGGFWPGAISYPHPYSPTGIYPATLQIVDLDADGIDEVVTVSPDNRPAAALNVYRRQPNGYLALSNRVPTWDSTTALLAVDVDGDGDKELVTGHHAFHKVSVIGAGGGGLEVQSRFDLPGFGNVAFDWFSEMVGSSHTLAVGDLDGDGCQDLAGVTFAGMTLLYGCEPYFDKIPVSDFDGDGFADLLYRHGPLSGVLYMVFRGEVICYPAICPPTHESNLDPQAFGDFDGDGNTDVFWREPSTGENMLSLATTFPRLLKAANPAWKVVGSGDFDGDDRSDLLWRNSTTGANLVWRSADAATQLAVASVGNLAWKVSGVGDFDGNGRSDILWRNGTTGANTIWRDGNNLTQQPMAGVSNFAWKIVGTGDFNADGRDDVVWRNAATGAGTIWLSANSATQRAIAVVGNPQWFVGAIADFNGDGYSDLYWRNAVSGATTIWLSGNNATQQQSPLVDPYYVLASPQP